MSKAATAAAIGIKITADEKDATKAIGDTTKSLKTLEFSQGRIRTELRDLSVDGLEKATFGIGRAAASTAKWGVGLGAVAATASAIGLIGMAEHFATGAAGMGRSADMLGIPVERLSQFGIAAHLAGSSAETMQAGLQGLQGTVADAAYGNNNKAWTEFQHAGIDVGDRKRGAADYAAMLPRIADQTQLLAKTNAHAAESFLDIIGVGRDLYPVLRNGSAGWKAYMDQAEGFPQTTAEDVQKGRELEQVMAGISEQFKGFERIGGAAVAPGLTKFLDTLGAYLSEHQADVTAFFGEIEHGIEWLTTPQNMKWLKAELDEAAGGMKELFHWAQEMEHSVILRRMLGLPVEQSEVTGDHTPLRPGMPMDGEDDPAGIEGAKHVGQPTIFSKAWDWLTGNPNNATPSGKLLPQLESESDTTAQAMGVPKEFARAIFATEGGLKPDGSARTSPAGAVGAGQLMPGTAEMYGVHDPTNLHQNVAGSVAYMRKLLNQFHGNEIAAAAAYNAGENNLGVQTFARTGDPSTLPPETQKYIRDVARREAGYRSDPGAERMAADAHASGQTGSGASAAVSTDGRADRDAYAPKVTIEVRHTNPPTGVTAHATTDSPSAVDIEGPRVMGAMPSTGTQRNVVRDGW